MTEIERAAAAAGLKYQFNDWWRANADTDWQIDFPLLLDIAPNSGRFSFEAGLYRDTENHFFAVLMPTELDFRTPANAVIVDKCKRHAAKFLEELNNGGVYQFAGDIKYTVVYDKLDRNLTGVCFELPLQPIYGLCEINVEE